MPVNAGLATLSDHMFTWSIIVYSLALVAYCGEYAFGRRGKVAVDLARAGPGDGCCRRSGAWRSRGEVGVGAAEAAAGAGAAGGAVRPGRCRRDRARPGRAADLAEPSRHRDAPRAVGQHVRVRLGGRRRRGDRLPGRADPAAAGALPRHVPAVPGRGAAVPRRHGAVRAGGAAGAGPSVVLDRDPRDNDQHRHRDLHGQLRGHRALPGAPARGRSWSRPGARRPASR